MDVDMDAAADGQPDQRENRPVDSMMEEEMASSEQGDAESVGGGSSLGGGGQLSTGGGGGAGGSEAAGEPVKFKLLSPLGGKYLEFTATRGKANRDIQEELQLHITNIFKIGLGMRESFEKNMGMEWHNLPWSDADQLPELIKALNKCIHPQVSLWRGATRPHLNANDNEWFQSNYCTADQSKRLSFTIFNRVVKNAHRLNKCYKSFSSETYGETSFDQIQIILDRLQMSDKDVFVDLGSGVGHVVTYAAAYSMAKKCVGIEINATPAGMATKMKKEFISMMSWYGKKYRPFDLHHGNFLGPEYRKLITEEATVIYINNFAFDPHLMFEIKQMIMEMPNGTRIICTKSLSEERDERVRTDEGGAEKIVTQKRPLTGRQRNRQTVDMMLDVEELPMAEAPVSWSAGKGVQFLLFTVNHCKTEQIFYETNNLSGGASSSSTRSGSAESVAVPAVATDDKSSIDKQMEATIDDVASAMGGGRSLKLDPYDDSDDDDTDYAPSARRFAGLKPDKRKNARDDSYVPKKRSSTGASRGRDAKKESKREKARRLAASSSSGGTLATSDAAMHKDAATDDEQQQLQRRADHHQQQKPVVLDPANPLDRHLSKSAAGARSAKKRIGEPTPKRRRGDEEKENEEPKEEGKAEEQFPFGKVAAAGHCEEYNKEDAPKWAGKVDKHFLGVYAVHHTIFVPPEEMKLPEKRARKSLHGESFKELLK